MFSSEAEETILWCVIGSSGDLRSLAEELSEELDEVVSAGRLRRFLEDEGIERCHDCRTFVLEHTLNGNNVCNSCA